MNGGSVDHRALEGVRWLQRRRGNVIGGGFGSRRFAYLLGPEANEFIFAHDHLFRWREAFAGLIPVDGETALIVSDGADHVRRRALVRPGLHRRQVQSSVQIMADSADDALDAAVASVPRGGSFDAYAVFRAAIRRSTMASLFGERIAGHADTVGIQLQPALDLIDRLPDTVAMHERLRTPLWRRAMTARTGLDAFVQAEIDAQRAQPDGGEDVHLLATLVHGKDGSGSGLTDVEVRDQVVSMIAAGYETTSAAMAWTLYGLSSRPDLMAKARDEVREVTGGGAGQSDAGAIGASALGGLELVSAIVTESLRLYPPAAISARYAAEGFEFGGRSIRAGTSIIFSPYLTHRDPELYPDPRAFRPERWLGTGAKRSPAEYLPFGGGSHRCIGSTMATTELTVMLARLLARSSFEVTQRRVRATGLAAMRPAHGMDIRLTT